MTGNTIANNRSMKKDMKVQHVKEIIMSIMINISDTNHGMKKLLFWIKAPRSKIKEKRLCTILKQITVDNITLWLPSTQLHTFQTAFVTCNSVILFISNYFIIRTFISQWFFSSQSWQDILTISQAFSLTNK